MQIVRKLTVTGGVLLLASLLGGCETLKSWGVISDDPVEERAERLRVPPDLATDRINDSMALPRQEEATYSAYAAAQASGVLPDPQEGIKVHKAAGQRWLEVAAPPEQVWDWVLGYLKSRGVEVEAKSAQLGVIQTDWLLHAAPVTRGVFAPQVQDPDDARVADSYRFRLDRGVEEGTTEVYVSHRRMARQEDDEQGWQLRSADVFYEAEMLRGLMLYLGVQEPFSIQRVAQAEAAERLARLERTGAGQPVLVLPGNFYEGWRRVGLALDRLGFSLEDRDRVEGDYYVRYDPAAERGESEEGFLESLAFWRDGDADSLQSYVVHVEGEGGQTRVTVRNEAGEPATVDTAAQILGLLEQQLR